ncbi:MAG TPA: ADP-ribosylation factor-like protein, partial [Candidatus Methanoperedens sp.]|nr:ADP-ribosylation factor-like protein [Candidatus Methanoperedens sp.]
MVLFNYAIREITAKIVYYGPGLCGKTTNLQYIHEKLDPGARGKLLSLATDGDRTLFFDFLPIEMGSINGYKVRFQLYTVPGQVHYNATRKLVLKGVDAVVFVGDSQLSMVERNRESFANLVENLAENGYELARVPVVIQLNKRDLPNVASPGELVAAMGVEGFPVVEAVAARGEGVFDTLKAVVKLTLGRLRSQFETEASPPGERREAPPPPPPAAVFAPTPPEAGPLPDDEARQPEAEEHIEEFDLEEYQAADEASAPPAGAEESAGDEAGIAVPADRAQEFEMFAPGGEKGEDFGLGPAAEAEVLPLFPTG